MSDTRMRAARLAARPSPRPSRRASSAIKTPAAKPRKVQVPFVNGHLLSIATLFNLRGNPGYYSQGDRVALLRRRRTGPHDEWLVDFSQTELTVQLRAADRDLLRGVWAWQATAAGHSLLPSGPWEEVCWHTDADGDYLEIEQPLSNGWRIERQMFLAREGRFLFLADALLGPDGASGEIRYESRWPLADDAGVLPAAQSRELALTSDCRPRATVLPLALPEWRAEFCHADLLSAPQHLVLHQAAQGRNLYAPLLVDLDPARQRKPLTWRRLTVAESLRTVSRDEAVGYRVQLGREQWLIYRTLAPRGNRSLLGVNTVADFLLSRFLKSGQTEPLIVIE